MKKSTKRAFLVIFTLTLVLAISVGCNEAPEDVKGDMSAIDGVQSKTNNDEFEYEYDTISGIRAGINNFTGNFGNVVLKGKVILPESNEAAILNLKQTSDFGKDTFIKALETFLPKSSEINDDYIVFNDWNYPNGYDYDNPDTGAYLGTGVNGFFVYNDRRIGEVYALPDITKRIRFSADVDLDEVYPTASGDWSPREAAEYAEKVANEQWAQFDSDFTFKAYAVYLYGKADETCFTEVALEKLYNGFNFIDGMISNDKGIHDNGLYDKYWCGDRLQLLFYGKEQLSIVWDTFGTKSVVGSEPVEKIITPQTAMRIVSKELSDETVFTFSELSLRYVMEWDGEFINTEEVYRDPETAGQEHIARPMWILKKYDADSSLASTSHAYMTMILVDAVTGDVYSYLHTGIGY